MDTRLRPTYLSELAALPVLPPLGVPALQLEAPVVAQKPQISSEVNACVQRAREKIFFALDPQTPVREAEQSEQLALLLLGTPLGHKQYCTHGVG